MTPSDVVSFCAWHGDRPAKFFRLRAVGAFLVSGEFVDGAVTHVLVYSEKGRCCEVQNPWVGKSVALSRNGVAAETMSGTTFGFNTAVGEEISLRPV